MVHAWLNDDELDSRPAHVDKSREGMSLLVRWECVVLSQTPRVSQEFLQGDTAAEPSVGLSRDSSARTLSSRRQGVVCEADLQDRLCDASGPTRRMGAVPAPARN